MIVLSNSASKLLIHLLFWTTMFYLRFITLQNSLSSDRQLPTGIPNFLVNVGLFYLISYLFSSPQKVRWIYALIISIGAYILYNAVIFTYLKYIYLPIETSNSPIMLATRQLVDNGFIKTLLGRHLSFYYLHDIGFELFFPLLVKISTDYYEAKIKLLQSEKEQTKLELEKLRSQLNPHFLFNNLNSIYNLSLQNLTHTSDAILKLSNLLRSTLYDSQRDWTLFSSEWQLISDYIDLAKWRYGKKVLVTVELEESINDILIPSFIFLNLVENAFKHGVENNTTSQKAWINMVFKKDHQFLIAEISNSYGLENNKSTAGGIGLNNTKRRLELLYGQKFELTSTTENECFMVKVVIPFTHNQELPNHIE